MHSGFYAAGKCTHSHLQDTATPEQELVVEDRRELAIKEQAEVSRSLPPCESISVRTIRSWPGLVRTLEASSIMVRCFSRSASDRVGHRSGIMRKQRANSIISQDQQFQ